MYPVRINKFFTLASYCSRRAADKLIKQKKVKINNQIAKLGDQVDQNDRVFLNNKEIRINTKEKVYLAFHKPVGIICTTDQKAKDNIIDYIKFPQRIFPIGRLDVNTSGLILLTNDGSIVNKILKGHNKVDKEYIVDVDKSITDNFLGNLIKGVILDSFKTLPAKVQKIADKSFQIIINEGKHHQIRRMCEEFGYNVIKLKRIRIGKVSLGDLEKGTYKKISLKELL